MLLQYDILVQSMHGVCLVCLSVQSLQEHCGLILILGSFLLCLYQQSIISNKIIFCTMKTIMCVKYLIDLVKTGTCTIKIYVSQLHDTTKHGEMSKVKYALIGSSMKVK